MGGWVIFNPKRSQTVVLISVLFCFRKPRVDRKDERVLILSIYWWHGNQDVQCRLCTWYIGKVIGTFYNIHSHLLRWGIWGLEATSMNNSLLVNVAAPLLVKIWRQFASAVQFPEPTERLPKNTPLFMHKFVVIGNMFISHIEAPLISLSEFLAGCTSYFCPLHSLHFCLMSMGTFLLNS